MNELLIKTDKDLKKISINIIVISNNIGKLIESVNILIEKYDRFTSIINKD